MAWRSAASISEGPGEANAKLTSAYRSVFKDGNEHSEIVLTDFAVHCQWFQVMPANATDGEIRHHNAMRAAFARIFNFLSLDANAIKALEEAARNEAAQLEGNFLND